MIKNSLIDLVKCKLGDTESEILNLMPLVGVLLKINNNFLISVDSTIVYRKTITWLGIKNVPYKTTHQISLRELDIMSGKIIDSSKVTLSFNLTLEEFSEINEFIEKRAEVDENKREEILENIILKEIAKCQK